MKTTFISLFALLLCLNTSAQSNFYKIGLGGGFGITQSFTDVKAHKLGKSFYGVGDYFFTPFFSLGGEGQMGHIKGDSGNDPDRRRTFVNSYKSFTINTKLYLGALIDYDRNRFSNTIKGLYAGAGLGGILNNVENSENDVPGTFKTKDVLIPLNIGINLYFPNRAGYYRYGVNINYQTTFSLGEGIDGFDDSPPTFKTSNTDFYTYFSVGLRYQFGPMGLSKKTLY